MAVVLTSVARCTEDGEGVFVDLRSWKDIVCHPDQEEWQVQGGNRLSCEEQGGMD